MLHRGIQQNKRNAQCEGDVLFNSPQRQSSDDDDDDDELFLWYG